VDGLIPDINNLKDVLKAHANRGILKLDDDNFITQVEIPNFEETLKFIIKERAQQTDSILDDPQSNPDPRE